MPQPVGINLEHIIFYGKFIAKYLALIGYLLFGGSFIYTNYYKKKLKKVWRYWFDWEIDFASKINKNKVKYK